MSWINAELSMNQNMERARAEAARAFHSTLLSEGVIIQTNALDAAIEAFLAAARADGLALVPIAVLQKIISRAEDGHGFWYSDYYTGSKDDQFSDGWERDIAEARAFAAMWDSAPEVKP